MKKPAAHGHRSSPPRKLYQQLFRRQPAYVCSFRLPQVGNLQLRPTANDDGAQHSAKPYTIIGDTFTLIFGNSGSFHRHIGSRSAMAPTWSAIRIAAGFSANISSVSVTMNTPGPSTGPMQVNSPRSIVNGHCPSVHVAALTALDCGIGDSSTAGATTSGDEHPTSDKHNPSPTANACESRSVLRWRGLHNSANLTDGSSDPANSRK